MAIEIRPLHSLEELHACEELQKRIWGFSDLGVVPHHLLLTAQKGGGVLLGAFDGDEIVGFVFGFLGYDSHHKRWKHCSLMCGVLPHKRYQGVGFRLKLAQRERVLAQGLDLITWTFDPLQSANAHFNFGKLGVIARSYEVNLYGDMRDELNRGLPTDRLTVEWWIRSPRVEGRLGQPPERALPDAPLVNRAERRAGSLRNTKIRLNLEDEKLLVEIPTDLNALKRQDPEAAVQWRLETREIFRSYLARGYLVSEFFVTGHGEERRGFYLLERRLWEDLLQR
jgi:predicted GNAT superfamily acetyltransferase